jgi:MSHA biogenesis protein MshJ
VKQQWEMISAKLLARSERERLMILAALLALVWMLFEALLLTPMLQKQKLYRQEISAKQQQVVSLQAQQAATRQTSLVDPDAGNKDRLAELQQNMTRMDDDLRAAQRQLISPDRMPKVLESVLQKDRQVRLVALATLPVSGLMDGVAGSKELKTPVSGIYKHGFEVTLEGSYPDLMRYVTALEASPWGMLWGEISLQAGVYPLSSLKLTLYTLSLDQAWLSI